jgi:hypothetical protein
VFSGDRFTLVVQTNYSSITWLRAQGSQRVLTVGGIALSPFRVKHLIKPNKHAMLTA